MSAVKAVVVGDKGIGKSALCYRIGKDGWTDEVFSLLFLFLYHVFLNYIYLCLFCINLIMLSIADHNNRELQQQYHL